MRLFVSGATATLRRYPDSPYLGTLIVPGVRNQVQQILTTGFPWAADNAAFSGFNPAAFCRMLSRIAGNSGCCFVACPDVVGDAVTTLRQFTVWAPVIRALELPPALSPSTDWNVCPCRGRNSTRSSWEAAPPGS